ncbi:MAG: SCP2 sterol-binding domain-containing protein [Lachnospiraceae bacterium]|nr:SCP2 sterol-binding domain-containing protein [Lachnospiraceae bacterium]
MTYAEFFSEVKGAFVGVDISDVQEHLAFQFNIIGEAEGIFYVEAKEGKLYIEPYEYFERDAIFICTADTLRKLISGELDPIAAFTVQKLRVEGNIDKALKLKELVDKNKAQKAAKKTTKKTTKKTVKKTTKKEA